MAFFALPRLQHLTLLSAAGLAREHELRTANKQLQAENQQLRQAVIAHATIDQAIGAVVALGQMPPEEAWRALRDVSQRTNTKLHTVAEHILAFAQGGNDLPEAERTELHQAITRYTSGMKTARAITPSDQA